MKKLIFFAIILQTLSLGWAKDQRHIHTKAPKHQATHAYVLADIILESIARDVEKIGARPTIIARQMAIAVSAMYDAWAIYDTHAIPAYAAKDLKQTGKEANEKNQKTAMTTAVYHALISQFPLDQEWISKKINQLEKQQDSPSVNLGQKVAQTILLARKDDGSNHDGTTKGSNGSPYSDYTNYQPVNPPSQVIDADRWGPLPFSDGKGGIIHPGYLTPHWHLVKTFALKSANQFRPEAQPKVGDPQLLAETDEIITFNNSLTLEQKAIVEFMRDGPRSTGQSGHWLKFAQDISRRDAHTLEKDVKLFFAIANVCLDAFIAAWDAKRIYDSSRPWHLVRHYYRGKKIRGWRGPGLGVAEIAAENWLPYSPAIFITPPFPGYVSGHSTVSAAAAKTLELFTGSDRYGFKEVREAGSMTEEKFTCQERQKIDGKIAKNAAKNCQVTLDLPTFSVTAEMAGISRVMGGYHIQADNIAGLKLGRDVAEYSWQVYQKYFNGNK
jgi:hypothetical protein